ncbi:MAG: MobF family relaxase [Saprospiraceae bacterium]
MLRITVSKSASGAAKYYSDALSKQDYYSEKEQTIGKWKGKTAEQLGLSGEVTKDDFEKLASNVNPTSDEKLNPRNDENRRAGYDFTFSVPKSVSLVHAITKDKEILTAFNDAVQKSMLEIEKDMQTQKGRGKNKEYQNTGNIAYASFNHDTTRPIDGVPDPHLHQHCYVFNTTKNQEKDRFQAIELGTVKANAPYYEALFHAELANNLETVGYGIKRNKRDFEIAGINRTTIDKFSNRTQEVEKQAKEKGVISDKLKDTLGVRTRARKTENLPASEIKNRWNERLTNEEKEKIFSAKNSNSNNGHQDKNLDAKQAIEYALSHHLERQSVISEKRLLGEAFKRGIGQVAPDKIKAEYDQRKDVLSKTDKRTKDKIITTKNALAEEKKLTASARKGKGQFEPINPKYQAKNDKLTKEQLGAVNHALSSKDFIIAITGGAGTGKTWSIKEVAEGMKEKGVSFSAFAPSSAASRQVQREEGFEDATTIADLLQNSQLQDKLKNGVLWIDEAGMVGNKTMNGIIDIAKKQNARILLTGDVKQHNSVERGDAFRIIQKYGGVKPAIISKIQRQKKEDYKSAVKSISDGKVVEGYKQLDKMGAIKEADDFEIIKSNVASEYTKATKAKEETLIVATTHAQGKAVTNIVRENLKDAGILDKREMSFTVQKNLSLTDAQKSDTANYQEGNIIQFHQNIKGGFKRGAKYDVLGKDDKGNILISELGAKKGSAVENKKEGKDDEKSKALILPIDNNTSKFSLYEKEEIKLAKGDKIRITQNGFDLGKKRLNNGNILNIKGFDKEGNIMASTGRKSVKLGKDFGHLTHGYYTTSQASQGKSVNRVIMLQTSASGKASNKEQFYVSASRGKFEISIHTDDKDHLMRAVQRSSQRITATEIANKTQDNVNNKKQLLKKINNIYKTGASKVSGAWKKSKEMISFKPKPKPVQTKTHVVKGR